MPRVLIFQALWAGVAFAIQAAEGKQACGDLIKSITFDGQDEGAARAPYTEELAYKDWAPYTYLDGFHGDMQTRGSNNERAWKVPARDSSRGLEVVLPKGCVTGACAMQVKSVLPLPVESATLKFKMKFGPDFDWVRGGKLPGLCGAGCMTGCKEVTGLDGFSSRHMWRPCVWPPEHPNKSINCEGGKLVAYVYHMFKEHWCGDDFEFSNSRWARTYSTAKEPVVPKQFFQPKPDEWYTVWSHVQMNTAEPPGSEMKVKRDGKLQTWLQGPGFEPVLVVDKHDMGWRVFNNVTIDTLYFSVFFGGSSPTFQARKDETIIFDDFQVWEGLCPPDNEPFSQTLVTHTPEWSGMKQSKGASNLKAKVLFQSASAGGGCGKLVVENTSGKECFMYEVDLNIRPSWGTLSQRQGNFIMHGAEVVDIDAQAGWFRLQSDARTIRGKETVKRAGFCVTNYSGAKYLPEHLAEHVTASAVCVSGPAATEETSPIVTEAEIAKVRDEADAEDEDDGGGDEREGRRSRPQRVRNERDTRKKNGQDTRRDEL